MNGHVKPLFFGRAGNVLFQAATAIAYALDHEMPYTVPNKTDDPKHNPLYLQHLVDPKFNPKLPEIKIVEKGHNFQVLPFQEAWRNSNIILDGYWQTEKYFKHRRNEIIQAFGYPWESLPGFVSVHVRRTDYLRLQKKHPLVRKEWIDTQMERFPGYHFIFFSDDTPWCEENYGKRKDVTVHKGTVEQDLIKMSCCTHHICSASTFSWWSAWLNRYPNKQVYIPKQWFGVGHGNLDTSDIVPPEWHKV